MSLTSKKLSFYGFDQSHKCDFPFLTGKDKVALFVSTAEEFNQFCDGFSENFVDIYSDNLELNEMPLIDFDPKKYALLIILNELSEETENFLISKALRENPLLEIADINHQSCPAEKKLKFHFRKQLFNIIESTEIPAYFTNWGYINFLVNWIEKNKCRSVLDMFSGSGAVGFSLANETKAKMTLVDANYHAVRSMRETNKSLCHSNTNVILSECFSALRPSENKFDLIVGNPPHMDLPLTMPKGINGRDPNFEIHNLFFEKAGDFLNDSGRIMLVENSFSGVIQHFYNQLPKNLIVEQIIKMPSNFWDIVIVCKS